MLIEQIIEFQLRGFAPPAIHVLLLQVIFMTKQKSPRKIFEWFIVIYCRNIAEGNVPYFPLSRSNHLENLILKCKTLILFWA